MISCPNCGSIQPQDNMNTGRVAPCPQCGGLIRVEIFNAFLSQGNQGVFNQSAAPAGQSECFYHPGKPAVVPCEDCGRMLCDVCMVEMSDRAICMNCLKAKRDKQKISTLQNRRVLYDSIAINLSFWPMLMIFPTLLTAPAAIFFAIKHLRTPATVLPKSWLKSILALLFGVGQVLGWILVFAKMITK